MHGAPGMWHFCSTADGAAVCTRCRYLERRLSDNAADNSSVNKEIAALEAQLDAAPGDAGLQAQLAAARERLVPAHPLLRQLFHDAVHVVDAFHFRNHKVSGVGSRGTGAHVRTSL
jgi:hypothetical protein